MVRPSGRSIVTVADTSGSPPSLRIASDDERSYDCNANPPVRVLSTSTVCVVAVGDKIPWMTSVAGRTGSVTLPISHADAPIVIATSTASLKRNGHPHRRQNRKLRDSAAGAGCRLEIVDVEQHVP